MFEGRKKVETTQVSFRMKTEEFKWIKARAEEMEITVVDYIRIALKDKFNEFNGIKDEVKEGFKVCAKCNQEKSESEFNISRTDKATGKVYLKTTCKECNKK